MKIIELRIDDLVDLSGVDGISLVSQPAIEEDWYYFSKAGKRVLEEKEGLELAKKLIEVGVDADEINEDEEWVVVGVKPINSTDDLTTKKELFATNIVSNPNESSEWDTIDSNTGVEYRIRYKYSGPQDSKNRTFCKDLMQANRIYRREDIEQMSSSGANTEFGQYSIYDLRGSYGCRHQWVELKYKKVGKILNKASIKRGVVSQDKIGSKDDTLTNAQLNSKATKSKDVFKKLTEIDGELVFSTKEEALAVGLMKGCEGYHEHSLPNGEVGFMACSTHPKEFEEKLVDACWPGYEAIGTKMKDGREVPNCVPKENFESFNDYPESAKNNACKVLKWRDEHPDEIKGMTRVGWTRANQLCKGENLSEDTVSRMASFERHRKNAEVSEENKLTPWKDAGRVAWLGWGGTSGIEWAKRKTNTFKREFSFDEEKRMIYSPAMIPNKFIVRRDKVSGELYYVFFSEDTIKTISQKYLKNKYTDKTNIEHTPINLDGVYVTESWLIEDTETDKAVKFGFNLPSGTWMVGMKVDNDKVWSNIKEGKLKGLSVEGYFTEHLLFNKNNERDLYKINK